MNRLASCLFTSTLLALAACEEQPEGTPLNPDGASQEITTDGNEAEVVGERMEEAQASEWTATGRVESVDPANLQVTLQHEPVEALGWPAMTMPFAVEDAAMLAGLEPKTAVEFTFREGTAGQYVITGISPRH